MRFRLNAGYREKEMVKALGARFDFREKYWYYEGESLPEGLRRWYEEDVEGPVRMDLTADRETQIEFEPSYGREHREAAIAGRDILGTIHQAFMSVTEVNQMITKKYQQTDAFQHVFVKGEVTNFRGHHGTHYYFDIKDENSQLSCRLWEATAARVLRFELQRGQMVGISGSLEYYAKNGTSQLIVGDIRNLGEGNAMLAYLQLKQRLEAEGIFALEHKKPIPVHPKKVGIITSKNGDAIKDILQKAGERNPYVQLVLFHVQVQGKNAVPSILKGIRVLDGMDCDTIIIGRGGGSLEELMVYDDESIIRAVYAAKTPIISAVGHDAHEPLLDLVADLRVSTPTSAADHALPDVMTDVGRLIQLRREMTANMQRQLERRQALLEAHVATLEGFHPGRKLKERQTRLENAKEILRRNLERIYQEKRQRYSVASDSLKRNMQNVLQGKKHRFEVLLTNLNGLSPTAKLMKGFGYISKEDRPLTSVSEVQMGDALKIRIHDGEIGVSVTNIQKKTVGE